MWFAANSLNDRTGNFRLTTGKSFRRAGKRVLAAVSVHFSSDGGAARWATVCSLITTAKLNDVEPFTYLRDVLERMSNGHAMSRIDDLLPWNWGRSLAAAA